MALKRAATASMLEQLKDSTHEKMQPSQATTPSEKSDSSKPSDTKEKNKKTNKSDASKKNAPKKPRTTSTPKTSAAKSNEKPEKTSTSNTSIVGFDFGNQKERELKSVRKQFVLTPTHAQWLKETAELNNISENKVIENMINMMINR